MDASVSNFDMELDDSDLEGGAKQKRRSTRLTNKKPKLEHKSEEVPYDKQDEDLLQMIFKRTNGCLVDDESEEEEEELNARKRESRISSQKNHLSLLKVDKLWQCAVCLKEFVDANSLKTHVLMEMRASYTTGKSTEVAIPGAADPKLKALYADLLFCDICGRRFIFRKQLSEHKQDHARMRICTCHICLKNFSSQTQLEAHLEDHSYRFPCRHCALAFKSDVARRRHGRREHLRMEPRRYECRLCGSVVTDLEAHVTMHMCHHGSFCLSCGRHFSNNTNFEKHLPTCANLETQRSGGPPTKEVACGLDLSGACVHRDPDVTQINVLMNSKSCEAADTKFDPIEGDYRPQHPRI